MIITICMMTRAERLRKEGDIKAVLRQSKRAVNSAMMLRVRKTDNDKIRSTVVVSTTVSKKATVRNRIKRQVRHQLKEVLKNISPDNSGYDIMISVKKDLLDIEPSDRMQILLNLMKQAGIKFK